MSNRASVHLFVLSVYLSVLKVCNGVYFSLRFLYFCFGFFLNST